MEGMVYSPYPFPSSQAVYAVPERSEWQEMKARPVSLCLSGLSIPNPLKVNCCHWNRFSQTISSMPWIHIDGQERSLSLQKEAPKGSTFTSGDYRIELHYGPNRQNEADFSYQWSKLTVRHGKQAKEIKIKGGCGC
jgi:hypothetical protein